MRGNDHHTSAGTRIAASCGGFVAPVIPMRASSMQFAA
jgi:hypothetical protein